MTLSISEKAEYLAEIGIEAWYPRYSLQNALQVELFIAQELKSTLATVPEDTSETYTQIPTSKQFPSKVSTTSKAEQTTKLEGPLTRPTGSLEEKPIRFALNLYIYNEYLIVSSLSTDYKQKQASAQKLLTAILRTILSEELALRHDHLISWPFFASPNANQGIASARQYVNGVIEHLTETHTVNKVIVFGGVLPKLNEWVSATGQIFEKPYLVFPSLYKMLSDPGLKRKAWQTILESDLV
ncbi:MAG: hypothetical protein P8X74_13805 [Reinekea sp.]